MARPYKSKQQSLIRFKGLYMIVNTPRSLVTGILFELFRLLPCKWMHVGVYWYVPRVGGGEKAREFLFGVPP